MRVLMGRPQMKRPDFWSAVLFLLFVWLLAGCGPAESCDRTSQHQEGWQCYEEEVGQVFCSNATIRRVRCAPVSRPPLGGLEPTGRFEWVDAGEDCFP